MQIVVWRNCVRKRLKSWMKSDSFQEAMAVLISQYLRFVHWTSRWEVKGIDLIDPMFEKQTCIACFWHGRMAMIPFMWRWPHKKIVALISGHSDGMMVARTFERLNVDYVTGSTNRGGVRAFKTLMGVLERQDVVAIIPDGPRGPAKKLSGGIIHLAKHSGQPIIPLAYAVSRFITFKSWDRFQFPLPFSRGVFIYGDIISVPSECGLEEMEIYRLKVEQALTALEAEADRILSCARS